jgi:hypothetical protein
LYPQFTKHIRTVNNLWYPNFAKQHGGEIHHLTSRNVGSGT